MLRTFLAIKLSEAIIDQIARQMAELRRHDADVAWVPERNLHVTLRFLGELDDASVAEVRSLARVGSFDPFKLRVTGLGAYPGLRNARTLWAGVEPIEPIDADRLVTLQSATESWARRVGCSPERRRYSPHVTLGRVRRPGPRLRPLVDDITTREFTSDPVRVEEFVLMKSTLSDQAAVYEVLERFELAGSS